MENEKRIKELFHDLAFENGQMGQTEIIQPKIGEVPYRVTEALNILRGNIQLSGYDLKTIAITSALAHEGKSSIAFRLAKNMAGLEKRVLYMDCDIRNSTIQSRYDIIGEKVGLSEYLCGNIPKEKIIYHTDDQWMDMVFRGAVAPNPSELISGPLFEQLMSYVRGIYDYVIVDTPPLNLVIDGLLVAKHCDGTILVVESGLTERAQAEKARQKLQYADIKILGAVLNKADLFERRYGYGYGYRYGYGYGYRRAPKQSDTGETEQKNASEKKGRKKSKS